MSAPARAAKLPLSAEAGSDGGERSDGSEGEDGGEGEDAGDAGGAGGKAGIAVMSAPRALKRWAMAAWPRSIGYPGVTVVSPSAARPARTSAMAVRRAGATTWAPVGGAGAGP